MADLATLGKGRLPARAGAKGGGGLSRRFHLYANTQSGFATLLILPALTVIFVVVFFPLLYSIWLSLAEVDLLDTSGPSLNLFGVPIPLYQFVGLANYRELAGDPLYWNALMRTVYFVTAFVIEATVIGLAMALVLNTEFFGRPILRAALLIPWSMSRVVVGLLWLGMLSSDFGALNAVMHRLRLIDQYIAFFENGFSALNTLVLVYVWNQAPFATVLFLAGLQSIPKDLYAAAEVDGAGFWRKLWHVTLPSLRPMMFLVLVLSTVNGFLMLDLIFVMTFGGPGNDTTTVSWHGYRTAFNLFQFGPGTAILFTLTLMCVVLTVVYQRLVLSKFQAE
ncbi:carbohydrate ABC transporter permease [Mesorhizobium sp. 1B3]|uniref:carbohydrate ABC transporter permease n=1 Tax=Mesorhizobium sp. 1B3 TaxID=3243599 RepID=UPI003D996E50